MLVMIEGIDGTGKTSVVNSLKDYFYVEEALFLHTPSDFIRDTLLGNKLDDIAKFFLFIGDMIDMREMLYRQSAEKIVFLDRFFVSTFVYQIALGNMSDEEKRVAIKAIQTYLPKFDHTFILTAKTEVAMQRSETRGIPADSFESAKIGVWEKRKQAYENICFSEISEMLGNVTVLDTTNYPVERTTEVIKRVVSTRKN